LSSFFKTFRKDIFPNQKFPLILESLCWILLLKSFLKLALVEFQVLDMNEWCDNDKFWDVMSHKIFSGKSTSETKKETEQIISLTEINPPSMILDLCCGQGRHSLELARKGFKVTGVDRTEEYLEKARKDALKENLSIEFIKEDMRYFKIENYYDAIIIMYTSFGYFEKQEENFKVLCNCYDSLNKSGLMLIDIVGKEILKRKFIPKESFEIDGITYIEERKIIGDWNRIENKWVMLKEDGQNEFTLSHWLYSEKEIKNMLREAGFKKIKILGNLSGAPYNNSAERLIVVVKR